MTRRRKRVHKVVLKYLLPATVLLLIASTFRFYVGLRFRVTALTIEGLHMLIDFVVTVMVIVALLVVYSRYAKKFPYGLFKVEDLIALTLSALILYSALAMALEVFKSSELVTLRVEPLIVQGVTIPIILLSAQLKKVAGDSLRSPSLRADVAHTLIDIVESLAVLVGLFLYYLLSITWIYYLTLAIAGLGLIATSVEVGKSSLLALLDLPKDKEMIGKMKSEIESLKEGIKVVDMRARWAGSVMFLELTVRLHPLITIEDSYNMIRDIINYILSRYEEVEDVMVKVEPTKRSEFTLALPQDVPSLKEPLSRHFGRAKYFTIVKVKEGKVASVECLPNPYVRAKRGDVLSKFLVGANIAEMLHKRGITDIITLNIGEIAFSILLRHGILIWSGKEGEVAEDLIKSFVDGNLTRLKKPTHEEAWKKPRP